MILKKGAYFATSSRNNSITLTHHILRSLTTPSTMAPNSAIVASGVGAFFQLLRISAFLISSASEQNKQAEDKIENVKQATATSPDDNAATGDVVGDTRRSSLMSGRRLSLMNVNGRLSMVNMGQSWRGGGRGNRATIGGTTTSSDVEGGQVEEDEPKTGLEAAIPFVSLFLHVALFGYFLSATILTSISSSTTRPEYYNAVYDSIPLGCATTAVFLGIILNLRDFQRKRFSSLQRMLYSMSSLILTVGCIVLVAIPPADGTLIVQVDNNSPTKVDIATLACLVIYSLLTIVEGRVCKRPKEVITKDSKKLKLNKRALMKILKPYFWPEKTATSATLNRFRAITTWLCVIASKACSLTAPILLGKASTALTRFDYETAIRFSIFYAVTQLAASSFKEAQSLVYLRVGQAAFVQLSELAFNHLHSLSLDWHLRKKLGEVRMVA
jgi:hypothetical protein